jgi:aspartyl protease family protein
MLKNALTFAGAAIVCAMLTPTFLSMLKPPSGGPATRNAAVDMSAPPAAGTAPAVPQTGFRELDIPADSRGQYYVEAMVGGESARFLVDTGASMVSISSELANRLGLFETASSPHYVFQTANGKTMSYGVRLTTIDFGPIYVKDVDAAVNPNMGGVNLLGANFLARMSSVEQRDRVLILRQ